MSAMLAAIFANTNGLNSSGLTAPINSMREVASASAAIVDHVSSTSSSVLLGWMTCSANRVESNPARSARSSRSRVRR